MLLGGKCFLTINISVQMTVLAPPTELEVKVRIKTGVRVHSVVHFGRHGNVEEEEIVIEVVMSEGVRRVRG